MRHGFALRPRLLERFLAKPCVRGGHLLLVNEAVGRVDVRGGFDLFQQRPRGSPEARGARYRPLGARYRPLRGSDGRQPLQALGDVGLVPHLGRELEPLLEQPLRPLAVVRSVRQPRQNVKPHGGALPVAYLPGQGQPSLRQPLGARPIP